jgi:CRISPR-associated exonuclease Cas4
MEEVLISALEHWEYCPRQCGLIHIEQVWDENVFTIRGAGLHQRADKPMSRSERGRRFERALPIWSKRYGLVGRADVVEFLADGTPVPVETKSGKASARIPERVQLCAQGLCLEEMFGRPIAEGYVFYAASQKRVAVGFDDELRQETIEVVEAVRAMMAGDRLPPAKYDRRCRNCSLIDACLPQGLVKASATRGADLFLPRPEANLG